MEKVKPWLGASRPPSRSMRAPRPSLRVHGNCRQLHNSRGIPAQRTPIVQALVMGPTPPRPHPGLRGDNERRTPVLQWPVLAEEGEAGRAPPTSGGVPTRDCQRGRRCATPDPLHRARPPPPGCPSTLRRGSRPLGFRGFLRALWTPPIQSERPRGLSVPFPRPGPCSPHRGPWGPGQGKGVPGGEAGVRLRAPFTWWRGVGPGAFTRAGAGPGRSVRGHPATA